MGAAIASCQKCQKMQNQLIVLFKNDPTTGTLLEMTPVQKQKYWNTIKDQYFYTNTVNLLLPDNNHKDKGFLYMPNKYLYEGDLKGEMMEGRGRIILMEKGVIYSGFFKGNNIHGEGKMMYLNQDFKIDGKWLDGRAIFVQWSKKNNYSSIQFRNGKCDEGIVSFADRSVFQGTFKLNLIGRDSILQGKGKLTYKNGDYLVGFFNEGHLQGQGIYFMKQKGMRFQGNFKSGIMEGNGTLFYNSSQKLHINWHNNKPHGSGELTINKQTFVVHYKEGIRMFLQGDSHLQ